MNEVQREWRKARGHKDGPWGASGALTQGGTALTGWRGKGSSQGVVAWKRPQASCSPTVRPSGLLLRGHSTAVLLDEWPWVASLLAAWGKESPNERFLSRTGWDDSKSKGAQTRPGPPRQRHRDTTASLYPDKQAGGDRRGKEGPFTNKTAGCPLTVPFP